MAKGSDEERRTTEEVEVAVLMWLAERLDASTVQRQTLRQTGLGRPNTAHESDSAACSVRCNHAPLLPLLLE